MWVNKGIYCIDTPEFIHHVYVLFLARRGLRLAKDRNETLLSADHIDPRPPFPEIHEISHACQIFKEPYEFIYIYLYEYYGRTMACIESSAYVHHSALLSVACHSNRLTGNIEWRCRSTAAIKTGIIPPPLHETLVQYFWCRTLFTTLLAPETLRIRHLVDRRRYLSIASAYLRRIALRTIVCHAACPAYATSTSVYKPEPEIVAEFTALFRSRCELYPALSVLSP